MRIGLDARNIYAAQRRGTGRNLIDLYAHLAELRPDWRVLAYHRQTEANRDPLPRSSVEPARIDMVGDRIDAWQRWRLPLAAWRDGADVLHCPANTCPTWMPIPTVVTIHDLIPLDMPVGRPPALVRRFEQSVRSACRHAAHIICPSRYTRDRLIDQFDADPSRVTVNYWAADSSMTRPISPMRRREVVSRYGIDGPFVLHFGAPAPRKNTRRLVQSWGMLSNSLRRRWTLLVVGLDEPTTATLGDTVADLDVTESVRLDGFADEADVPALLGAADVLAYPSLAEGFGLPVLDAWACGTAVLAGDAASLPEIAADAALLVDPTDSSSIADGLAALMSEVAHRQVLIERGRRRLEQFTWQATAQRFARVMEAAAGLAAPARAAA